jgi:hypothetical protein
MEGEPQASSLPSRLRPELRGAWEAFLRWRRERWQVRALIVLLLGLYFMPQPSIVDLVDMAIQGIFASSEPKVMTSGARFHRAMEADRLRRALRVHLRAEGGKAARDLRIAPADLKGRSSELDLGKLVGAARSAGLVQDSYTARTVRRRALALGRSDAEGIFGPARAEIAKMLDGANSPANWSVKSWFWAAHGLVGFGFSLLGPADGVTAAVWLFLCYYACRLAAALGGRRGRWIGPWVPTALVLAATVIWLPSFRGFFYSRPISSRLLVASGWSLLTFAAAWPGSRSRPPEARSGRERLRAFLPIAACLAAWGMLSLLKRPLSWWIYPPPCMLLAWIIPIWLNVAFAVLGTAGIVAILVFSRKGAATHSA